jgi:glycosyltransferase involved in cell wall biosynthesis
MEVLAISTARKILKPGSRDRVRMRSYSERLAALHIVVLTVGKKHGGSGFSEGNLHVYTTNSRNSLFMLFDAFRISRKIIKSKKRNSSIVISAQDPLWIGWLSWVLSWSQTTFFHVQAHGDYFDSAWSKGSVLREFQKILALFILKRAAGVRVVSERIKKSLIKRGVSTSKITVLPIRPELERFLEQKHVYATEPPYNFLYVGRLAPEKDLPRLLKAFSVAYKSRQDIRLHLVGEGKLEPALQQTIETEGLKDVVLIERWKENIEETMSKADVLVLSSLHEAYGLVLVEAMAVGLPVITTDVGCVGEVIEDKRHGIVVDDEGVQAYAKAMLQMVHDPHKMQQMGISGKQKAREISAFSADAYVDAWVKGLAPEVEQV